MELSKREIQVLTLHAIGLTPDEIGDQLSITRETARTTLRNIKSKTNWHKATELTAWWWCNKFHVDFIETRNQILSATLLICVVFTGSFMDIRRCRRLLSSRKENYSEIIQQTET